MARESKKIVVLSVFLLALGTAALWLFFINEKSKNASEEKVSVPLSKPVRKEKIPEEKVSISQSESLTPSQPPMSQNTRAARSDSASQEESTSLVRELFEAIKTGNSTKVQELLPTVARLRGAGIAEEIGHYVKNPTDEISRYTALNLLGGLSDPKATEILLDLLKSEKKNDVRKHIISVLSSKKDEKVISALSEILEKDPDTSARFEAAWSLALIQDKKATPTLLKTMETEQNKRVLDKILWALGEIGDRESVNPLLQILYTTQRKEVRDGVRGLLARIQKDTVYASLLTMLSSPDGEEQKSALRALAQIKGEDVFPLFETILRYGQNADVKKDAIDLMTTSLEMMSHADTNRKTDLLTLLLTAESDHGVKIKAVQGLARIKSAKDKTLPILREVIATQEDLNLRRTAITALASGSYDLNDVRVTLMEIVRYDKDPFAQLDAIQALGALAESQRKWEEMQEFFEREAIPTLKQRISSTGYNDEEKSYAITVLGMIGGEEMLPFLENIRSKISSGLVQKSVFNAIQRIRDKKSPGDGM